MSVPQVKDVRVDPDTASGLAAAALLHPREGAAAVALLVRGWVVGAESRALAVEIAQGDRVVRVAPVREPSPDVAAAHPDRPEAAHCEFITRLHTPVLEARSPLVVRAVLADGRRVRIATIVLEPRPAASGARPGAARRERPTLRHRIEQLAVELAAAGTDRARMPAASALLAPPGESAEDLRIDALQAVDVAGRRVLDLGSRAGHLARSARARGAGLVDGIERDERLLLLSRLLNAYHGTARVSFAASLAELDGPYDVVLAPAEGDPSPDPAAVARLTDGMLLASALPAQRELRAAFPVERIVELNGAQVVACAHRQEALPA